MAENKKSFVLYVDLIHTVESLKDNEAGRLLKHILRYVNDLNPKTPDKITGIVFEPIKQQMKRDLIKWEDIKISKSDSGKLGNLKRWNNDLYLKDCKKHDKYPLNEKRFLFDSIMYVHYYHEKAEKIYRVKKLKHILNV